MTSAKSVWRLYLQPRTSNPYVPYHSSHSPSSIHTYLHTNIPMPNKPTTALHAGSAPSGPVQHTTAREIKILVNSAQSFSALPLPAHFHWPLAPALCNTSWQGAVGSTPRDPIGWDGSCSSRLAGLRHTAWACVRRSECMKGELYHDDLYAVYKPHGTVGWCVCVAACERLLFLASCCCCRYTWEFMQVHLREP